MSDRCLLRCLLLLIPGLGLLAEEPSPPISPSLEERLQALEQQLATKPSNAERPTAVVFADSDRGFAMASADGSYRLRIWGYLHAEARGFIGDDEVPLTNSLLLRRARIVAEGSVGPFDFRIMPEFNTGAGLQDAFVATTVRPWFKLRVGRGKVPVGMELLQSDTVTMFIERAYPSQLVPNRDTGAQVTGDLLGGGLSYAVGVYNGTADGASREGDNSDAKDGIARLLASPWKGGGSLWSGLSVGVGGSFGHDTGVGSATTLTASGLSTYKSTGQATIFAYRGPSSGANLSNTTIADGSHWRLAPQLAYAVGPFSAMAEYTRSVQEVSFAGNRSSLAHHAWQLSASWVLTGEKASFQGVSPDSPLQMEGGGWGALELVTRIHRLDLDEDAFAGGVSSPADPTQSVERATGFAVGLNWYLTHHTKLKLDYEQTVYVGGAGISGDLQDRETERLISAQVQLTF